MAEERWLIAGLGNPGAQYAGNRHNVGYMVADVLAARVGSRLRRERTRVLAASGRLAGLPVLIVKPMSFMNLSGGPLRASSGFHKIPPSRVVVIHDELDLPFGAIRLKLGGGDNGHNGLRSVSASFGTRDYYRVRVGVGRPPGRRDPADFVLDDFRPAERKELPLILESAADAAESILRDGLAIAQNKFNGTIIDASAT
jgi:peptidyl-tRNA hydrolase, PTH1 family